MVPKTHLFEVEANSSASDSLDSYDQWHFINVSLNYLSILESPGIIIPNIPLGDTVQSGVITEQKTKKEQKAVVVAVNSLLLLHQGQLASDERQSTVYQLPWYDHYLQSGHNWQAIPQPTAKQLVSYTSGQACHESSTKQHVLEIGMGWYD